MTVTANGFLATDYVDRRAAIATRFQELAGANVATDEGTVEGDLISLIALTAQRTEEQLVLTYAAPFLRFAAGALLDLVAEPIVGQRRRATSSVAEAVPLTGVAATVIPAGSAILPAGSTVQWVLLVEVILDGAGEGEGDFEAEEAGALAAVAATTWTIATPVAGWTTVGPSATDAEVGRLEESDEEYRRRAFEAQRTGTIARDVWRVEDVELVNVLENETDTPDVVWGMTHWIELLVVGGDDDEIAAAIHGARGPGIGMQGNTTVAIAVDNYVGGSVQVKFSRPVEVDVYVAIVITKGEGYPSSTGAEAVAARVTALKNAVISWASTNLVPGADVYADAVKASIYTTIPGIKAMTLTVGLTPTPLDAEVVIAVREVAVIDFSFIGVTGA
jgi:uncharacterized phage protein gp47/JayE